VRCPVWQFWVVLVNNCTFSAHPEKRLASHPREKVLTRGSEGLTLAVQPIFKKKKRKSEEVGKPASQEYMSD